MPSTQNYFIFKQILLLNSKTLLLWSTVQIKILGYDALKIWLHARMFLV